MQPMVGGIRGFMRGRRAFHREAMAKHHTYSIEFKRQVAQEYIAGETLHALAKRHDLSRNLIRIWVAKYEAGSAVASTNSSSRQTQRFNLFFLHPVQP